MTIFLYFTEYQSLKSAENITSPRDEETYNNLVKKRQSLDTDLDILEQYQTEHQGLEEMVNLRSLKIWDVYNSTAKAIRSNFSQNMARVGLVPHQLRISRKSESVEIQVSRIWEMGVHKDLPVCSRRTIFGNWYFYHTQAWIEICFEIYHAQHSDLFCSNVMLLEAT